RAPAGPGDEAPRGGHPRVARHAPSGRVPDAAPRDDHRLGSLRRAPRIRSDEPHGLSRRREHGGAAGGVGRPHLPTMTIVRTSGPRREQQPALWVDLLVVAGVAALLAGMVGFARRWE